MNRLLIVAVLLAVLGLMVAGPALAQQQGREEITVLIPLKYMSAATAAQIFGGTVIPASPYYGQNGFGIGRSGGVFGGSHYGNANNGNNYGSYGNYGVGSYQSGQNVGGYGSRNLGLGRSYYR